MATAPVFSTPLGNIVSAKIDFSNGFDGSFTGYVQPDDSNAPALMPGGASFATAVQDAQAAARADSGHTAQAVLQATDGSWYIAPIGTIATGTYKDGSQVGIPTTLRIDGTPGTGFGTAVRSADISRTNSAVQAVVGTRTWVDLRTAAEGRAVAIPAEV